MPLEAHPDSEAEDVLMPSEVKPRVDVFCPECGEPMRVVRSHKRDGEPVIRHFRHKGTDRQQSEYDVDCDGRGEGDTHARAKEIAVGALDQFYDGGVVESEKSFECNGIFDKSVRLADAAVTFDEPREKLGAGIVVEVQDKHKDKDVLETTRSYLAQGYSVCWLSADSFGSYSMKYSKGEFESLVHGELPDAANVFDANLNVDGTVPLKEMYPLIAPAWPHCGQVVREARPRVDAGWAYPAYEFNAEGANEIKTEPAISADSYQNPLEHSVKLPREWYEDRARQYYRETDWSEFFSPYMWDTKDVRRGWGECAKIDSLEIRLPPDAIDDIAIEIWNSVELGELFRSRMPREFHFSDSIYESEAYIDEVRESLNRPLIDITYIPWSKSQYREWYEEGFQQLSTTRERVPPQDEWSGALDIDIEQTPPELCVELPAELRESAREQVHKVWDVFCNENYDNVIRLTNNNADRACAECGDSADYYLISEVVDSEFLCQRHASF